MTFLPNTADSDTRTIKRVKLKSDFVQIPNTLAQDAHLSYEARGLLLYLLSLLEDWKIKVSHLQKQGGLGRDSVRRLLRELQRYGYVSGYGEEGRKSRGRFGKSEIVVHMTPDLNPEFSSAPENQAPVNQALYIEQNQPKTEVTKDTPTQRPLRVRDAQAVAVCVNSKFSLEDCRRYAEHLRSTGQGINNPGGYGTTIHRTGSEDAQIARWLAEVEPQRVQSGELPAPPQLDTSACPDCRGGGITTRPRPLRGKASPSVNIRI